MTTWTWETLTTTDTAALKELMRTGETPDPAAIQGRTYEGLNRGLVPKITGERFKKVFHEGEPIGHNVVERGGKPTELGWFTIAVAGRTMLFDYDEPRNRGLNFPLRALKDDVVLPNPGDHDLLLGKARWLGIHVAYFVLRYP